MSSPWIFEFLKQGISRTSGIIQEAGVIPTPASRFLPSGFGYSGGVMISASHIRTKTTASKVFASDGTKLSEEDEEEIENESLTPQVG